MNGNKILVALSYWSVFFAPIIFPIIIWIIGENETKIHAKKALWTHIIPGITAFLGMIIIGMLGITSNQPDITLGIGSIIIIGICGIISIYFFIWNIVKGIQVLKS
ncbi:DUF4870 domain-containing protein [Bacillus cytotoxicus]